MAAIGKIDKIWKESTRGRICTATAYSKEGKLLAKSHIILAIKSLTEFYQKFDDSQIEQIAEEEVKFMVEHPDLFQ